MNTSNFVFIRVQFNRIIHIYSQCVIVIQSAPVYFKSIKLDRYITEKNIRVLARTDDVVQEFARYIVLKQKNFAKGELTTERGK